MTAQIADFNLRFNAETVQFKKDVEYAKKMLKGYTKEAHAANDSNGDFSKSLKDSAKELKNLGGITASVTATMVAGFTAASAASVALVRKEAERAREIERMATVSGLTVEQVQSLSYASEQYNISGEKMADILKDVQDKLGDFAATGGGEFKDFFEQVAPKVGLTVEELSKLSGPEALIAVKDALDAANVPMKEQTFYLEAIANDASALIPLLENKGKRLYELTKRYEDLNVTMSEYDIEQFKQMDQQIADMELKLGRAFSNLSRQVSFALLPAMNDVDDMVSDLTKGVKDYTNQIKAFGVASATINVMSGSTLREKHRELFSELQDIKEDLAKYDDVKYEDLPSINPFGLSKNEWFNLQADYGRKKEELKKINDVIISEQKRTSELLNKQFNNPKGNKDSGEGDNTPPVSTPLNQTSRLDTLDQQYASELDRLKLAHESRLNEIENFNFAQKDVIARGYESLDALKADYSEREKDYYAQQIDDFQTKQDQAIQREIDSFARKEDAKTKKVEEAARLREGIEKRLNQQMLAMQYNVANQTLGLIEQTAKEGSIIQKAAFVAQKAMAAMQVYQQGEVAAMAALAPPPVGLGPTAGAGYAGMIRGMAAASAGMIMGQALAGMAHNGMDFIPNEGTWLLDKGERVYTNDSARQIDQMYRAIMSIYQKMPAANSPSFNTQQVPQAQVGNVYHFEQVFKFNDGANEEQIGNAALQLKTAIKEVIASEKRPGGLLWS